MDQIGTKYNLLTIRRDLGKINGRRKVECECDCGSVVTVTWHNVKNGNTKSCGCWKKRVSRDVNTIHGYKDTSIYNTWKTMKSRCKNPNLKSWRFYGGRGVTICERWDKSFMDFLADMGEKPFPKAQIDRIDGTRGYEPGNCRWTTSKINQRNRVNNVYLTLNGETLLLVEWAERTGVNRNTLNTRLHDGWTVERTLTTPSRRKKGE